MRELEAVRLSVNNDNATWAAGESRFFTVIFEPQNAVITEITLEQNIEGMVEIYPGEQPNKFRVMARKAGRVKLTARAKDQNGVTAQDALDFNITGSYQPSMQVSVASDIQGTDNRVMPKRMVTDAERAHWLTLESDNDAVQFNVTSQDPTILDVKQDGDKWQLDAKYPGETQIKVEMTDMFGDKQVKEYSVAVFGHCTLQAVMNFSYASLGLDVIDYSYEPMECGVEFEGTVYGWPGSYTDQRVEVRLDGFKDVIDLEAGASYPELTCVVDAENQIYTHAPYRNQEYDVRGFTLQFLFDLDSPYIIIDEVLNPDLSRWGNYTTRVSFEQRRIASREEIPDQVGDDGSKAGGDGVDSWGEAITVEIPL